MLLAHVEGSLASNASRDCNGESWETVTKLARLQEPNSSISGGGMGVSRRSRRVGERGERKNQHAGFLWSHACMSGGTFNRKRRAGSRLQSCGRAGQQDGRMAVASLAKAGERQVPCVTIFEMLVEGARLQRDQRLAV